MGLFEAPDDDRRLLPLRLEGADADLRVFLEEKLIAEGPYLDGALIFNLEGWGRFRLYLEPIPVAPR